MVQLICNLLKALVITILLEGIVVALWKRRKEWIVGSLLCNLATNPLLNVTVIFLNSRLGLSNKGWYVCVCIGEFLVVLTEMWMYRMYIGCSYRKGLTASLILNAVSYFGGVLLSDYLW